MITSFTLDKPTILERLGGDEDLLIGMSEVFVQESDGYCHSLEQAVLANDANTLRREAHTVKSLLATFADEEGAALGFAIEQQAKTGQIDGLGEQVRQLQDRVRLVVEVVRQELKLG